MSFRVDLRLLFMATVAVVVWAMTARAQAQQGCPSQTGFEQMFQQTPAGSALVNAVADAALQSPGAAQAIVCEARRQDPDKQSSAGAGLRRAFDILSATPNGAGDPIAIAIGSVDGPLQEAFNAGDGAQSTMQADARVYLPTSSGGLSGGGAVSPSKP